jgi:histidine triad (HIT) family protein
MSDCLFCKISNGQIPSEKIHDDDDLFAIHDINPQAPVHVLLVPHKHLVSLNDVSAEDEALLGRILLTAQRLARELGEETGYRIVNNCGASAGQSVFHIHFHLLGGRSLSWPPG